jgi:hypothetical protein
MNEVPQLAGAMLAIAFAAVMLVAGQLYIEKSARLKAVPSRANGVGAVGYALCEPVPVENPRPNSWLRASAKSRHRVERGVAFVLTSTEGGLQRGPSSFADGKESPPA